MQKAKKLIVAFVGMPGAGKSEATLHLQAKGIPFVRFGDITDEGLAAQGKAVTPENEQLFRESIREELGMAAYAIRAKPKIEALLEHADIIAIDGLYSWDEYKFLKKAFSGLTLIHVFAEPEKRYARLAHRAVRPLTHEEAHERDIAEIEKLDKGGSIAIADYLIENDDEGMQSLFQKVDTLLERIQRDS